jgi:exodeoxyribonuclease V beta subunit
VPNYVHAPDNTDVDAMTANVNTELHVSPLSDMPAGTHFGLIVHEALEHLDTNPKTLESDMTTLIERFVSHNPLPGLEVAPLVSGLLAVMRTPLGALTQGRCLADIPSADRLAELSFELPLGPQPLNSPGTHGRTVENNSPTSSQRHATLTQHWRRLTDLADLFSDRALVPSNDPLSAYGNTLRDSKAANRSLSGWLTGSIDALLRLPDGRFVIVDYKTNRFPTPPGSPLFAEQYSRVAMADAMIKAHYPLQALLYCVAVSRFLSWRVSGFTCATHLAGVGYLFVRGMIGSETPIIDGTPCGVFTWYPTPELIAAASSVLSGGGLS